MDMWVPTQLGGGVGGGPRGGAIPGLGETRGVLGGSVRFGGSWGVLGGGLVGYVGV